MKQRHIVGRILSALLALFVVLYIGGVVWNTLYDPVKTVSAIYISAEDSIEVTGFVVREEKTLDAVTSGTIEMQVGEGERAAKGDAVALVYASETDQEKAHQKKELAARITRLETLMNQGNEVVDLATVDTAIVRMGEQLLDHYETGEFSHIPSVISQIKDKTMSREYIYRDRAELSNAVNDLKKEQQALGKATVRDAVYASSPGYYSSQSDGYETVLACSRVSELTPQKYRELAKTEAVDAQNDGTLGKIITQFYWDFVVLVDQASADRMQLSKSVTLHFDSPQYPSVPATVYWKSEADGGEVTVALRVQEHIADFTTARRLRAGIVIQTYEGLKVPREAMRVNDEGEQGVYCLIDSQVKFKPVEPVFEKDSYYIVKYDSADTKSLLLYDEIVVSAKELEDRKMVK